LPTHATKLRRPSRAPTMCKRLHAFKRILRRICSCLASKSRSLQQRLERLESHVDDIRHEISSIRSVLDKIFTSGFKHQRVESEDED